MPRSLPIARHLAPLLDGPVTVVDVGARDADPNAPWADLPNLQVYGFDPDPAEVERLNAAPGTARYFPFAIGEVGGYRKFFDNNAPGGGSFYPQNRVLTDRWKFECIDGQKTLARDYFFPTEGTTIDVVSLDWWAGSQGIAAVDLIKLNIQGAELDALRGAANLLKTTAAVFLEVSFVESYVGRPLFADVDAHMRAAGFEFFDLLMHHPVGRAASPYTAVHARAPCSGQLIEAHALYLRPLSHASLKLAMIAEAFGQVEYAFEVLREIDQLAAFHAAAAEYVAREREAMGAQDAA